tara:strand:+ start:72 stop:638 length:567 start_codon:yes stop_codon:yes gene_type:complete
MILIIDNFDSFTYNIYQRLGEMGYESEVVTNEVSIAKIKKINPSHIIISPGPCTPNETGNCKKIIKYFYKKIPILGICLGHQCIAQVFGSKIVKTKPFHGKEDLFFHNYDVLFRNVKQRFTAARYHSLIVETLPKEFQLVSWNDKKLIMGIKHQQFNLYGIQYHPESILTQDGYTILKNFIENVRNSK